MIDNLEAAAERFRKAWHLADEEGRKGERVTDGLLAAFTPPREVPLAGLTLQKVDVLGDDYDPASTGRTVVDDLDAANVITSKVVGRSSHKILLDLDVPAKLIPSSTPGHSHLYIDRELTWEAYGKLLHALAEAGVIERGYVGASGERGYTALRLPWIRKEPQP